MRLTRRSLCAALASLSAVGLLAASGCDNGSGTNSASPGSAPATAGGGANPTKLVFGFVPSVEADKIADTAKPMADFVSKEIGIPIETFTSTDYAGMVEAMGSKKVDIGSLAPFAYVLAKDQGAADVILKTSRRGTYSYPWMIVVRANSGIKKIEDLKGKKMAFVDPSSTSGYLFPAFYLKKQGYEIDNKSFFSDTMFAGSHDTAVRAVYNGDVDAACCYDDVRNKLEKAGLKDVKTKVVILYNSSTNNDTIPNDTLTVRSGLDPALKEKIKAAFLKFAATPDGKKTLADIYEVDNLAEAKDSDYDPVREVAKAMNVNLNAFKKGPKGAPASPAAAPSAVASPATAAKP